MILYLSDPICDVISFNRDCFAKEMNLCAFWNKNKTHCCTCNKGNFCVFNFPFVIPYYETNWFLICFIYLTLYIFIEVYMETDMKLSTPKLRGCFMKISEPLLFLCTWLTLTVLYSSRSPFILHQLLLICCYLVFLVV